MAPVDQDETRRRILEAALEEAAEKGFRGATTRAIAARAGVNEVTLFRHFGNKAALARAAFEQQMSQLISGGLILPPPGESFEERLANGARALADLLERQRPQIHLALREARSNPLVRALAPQAPARVRRRLAQWFAEEQRAGAMRPIEPELAAQVFVGVLFTTTVSLWAVGAELPWDRETFVRALVEIFSKGTAVGHGAGGAGRAAGAGWRAYRDADRGAHHGAKRAAEHPAEHGAEHGAGAAGD